MLFLCVFIVFQTVCSYDVTPTSNNSLEHSDIFQLSENTNTSVVNSTKVNKTENVFMERITQPSQTQQIERTLEPHIPLQNSSLKATKKEGNFENFKPSPLLDIQYEFNKYPVKPALPEAKTFGSFNDGYSAFGSWAERPVTAPGRDQINNKGSWFEGNRGNPWDENSKFNVNSWVDKPTTTEQTWISRVKFPTTPRGSPFEKPYKFVTNDDNLSNYPLNFPITTESFPFNKPVEMSNNNNKPREGFWDKLMSYNTNKDKNPGPIQKTFFDYNLLEKPPHYDLPKEHEQGISTEPNPWKKVIKLLTTIIPIGLLISALTPTVITVTSMNDTQSRYRADDPIRQSIVNRLASSQIYVDKLNSGSCEEKILCELLVNASTSKNYEEHIENILNTFTDNEHEDLRNRKEALLKVFEAVKKEDCSAIFCRNIKNPT